MLKKYFIAIVIVAVAGFANQYSEVPTLMHNNGLIFHAFVSLGIALALVTIFFGVYWLIKRSFASSKH